MKSIKRLLRRLPFLRWCALRYARDVRKKQRDISFAHHQATMGLIGQMTVTWAGIDLILSNVIAWHKSQTDPQNEWFPRDTSRKLAYLKDHIESDARIPADRREKVRAFRVKLGRLNTFRKSIVHGQLYQRNRLTLEWSIHSVRADGSRLLPKTQSITSDQIRQATAEIADTAHEMSPFFALLIGLDHPANRR